MKKKSQVQITAEEVERSKGRPSELMRHPYFQGGLRVQSWMRARYVTLPKVSGPKKPFKIYSGSEGFIPGKKSTYRHTIPVEVEKRFCIKFVRDTGTQLIFILLPKPAPKKVNRKKLSPVGKLCADNDSNSNRVNWAEYEVLDDISALEFICNNNRRKETHRQIVIWQMKKSDVRLGEGEPREMCF